MGWLDDIMMRISMFAIILGSDNSMASGPPDVTANQETTETLEESPGKKKSKFQTFKNFFAKKKRKDTPAPTGESPLKSSQSTDNVNGPEATPTHPDADQDSGSQINMGSKAMSHDSVFVSDSHSLEANDGLASSQDSLHGKVKSLQMQLKQAIKLGSPPSLLCGKKGEDGGTLSEDDGLPCSPPEISTLHTVLTGSPEGRTSSPSLEGSDSENEQMSVEASSRQICSPVSLPLDFSEPANFAACLDNSAARHRIAVKQRACAKRKPASRELFESGKVKILSGRVPHRIKEDALSAAITEPSAEEDNEAVKSEVDAGEEGAELEEDETEVSGSALIASHIIEKEPAAPGELADDEDVSSSSFVVELEVKESLPVSDPDMVGSPVCLSLPDGHHGDIAVDSECEAPGEEPGSLLQEVLSSLECPLTSAFVLKTDTRDLLVREDQVECLLTNLTDEPPSSSNLNQDDEDEEHDLPPGTDKCCGLYSPDEDEQSATEEEHVEVDESKDVETEVVSHDEGVLEKEPDFSDGDGEEIKELEEVGEEEVVEHEELTLEEAHQVVVEEVEEGEAAAGEINEQEAEIDEAIAGESVMESVVVEEVDDVETVMEEAVIPVKEKVDIVTEEEKEIIEEDEEAVEMEGMRLQEKVEDEAVVEEEDEEEVEVKEKMGETEVGVEMIPEAPQPKSPTDFVEEKDENDEENLEDLKAELDSEIHELNDPEEIDVVPESDSGAQASEEDNSLKLLSDSGSYSHSESIEKSAVTLELFPAQVRDDASPAQPPAAAISPSSREPGTPVDKPSLSSAAPDAEEPSSCSSVADGNNVILDTPESSKVRFTIAPAWQRSHSGGTPKEPPFPSPINPEAFQEGSSEKLPEPEGADATESPFGVKLRKTTVLLRYNVEGSGDSSPTGLPDEPETSTIRPQAGLPSTKPALPKKPDPLEDSSAKPRKTAESALSRGPVESVTSPSWISVAKQKQKSFQENPIDESPGRKNSIEPDEANLPSSPLTVSCSLEMPKSPGVEKEGKRAYSSAAQTGQDEPPWLALAKKKAKAWSEMPQIVQ
ncbi:hypothetical protein GJAV_G00201750 [Gymnothorax javanicus]|nr:hypothetical protein GJAV_G00201750 [Gymnothorax javanicus]